MQSITFRDRIGHYMAYSEDGQRIYLYDGRPAGVLLIDKSVHALSGAHIGWFVDGWLIDRDGYCLLWNWPHSDAGPPVMPVQSLERPRDPKLPWPSGPLPDAIAGGPPSIRKAWPKVLETVPERLFHLT